ncbi:hypothetical protein CDL15_Pgr021501 [Punica granatum]|uniref:Uncharacterized protein n=1 Tax=Punica granatum TaxID=22663 RepID=A0A218XNC5_PUNGR|nr:hypothetical protein CDL15_Pgr021501 [Punica granatum]
MGRVMRCQAGESFRRPKIHWESEGDEEKGRASAPALERAILDLLWVVVNRSVHPAPPLLPTPLLRPFITTVDAASPTPPPTAASIIPNGSQGHEVRLDLGEARFDLGDRDRGGIWFGREPGLAISGPTFTQDLRETRVGRDLRPGPNPWFSCTGLVEARIMRAQTREKKTSPWLPSLGSPRSVAHDLGVGFASLGRSHPWGS